MSDREKVIKELEVRIISDTDKGYKTIEIPVNEAEDILALLKEHEPKEVKDKSKRIKLFDEYFEGECPSCRSFLDEHSNRNFCGYCGQAVKWDA